MRKIFSIFAALTLSVGLWAIDNVAYIDANGQPQTANGVTEITNASATLEAGWYVVNGTDVQTSGLVCNGAVNIILADGAKLTATGGSSQAGIQVLYTREGPANSLTIYAQSADDQMGQLIATGGQWAAGIGGKSMNTGSNITINGGKITANGGNNAAGIGGGYYSSGRDITINGGIVTATGGESGAGIGGVYDGYNITINGGTVTANGGDKAAGIGGGGADDYSGYNITINGGTVTATGGNNAAGIGGGNGGDGYDITITDGIVTANGGENASGIGGGNGGSTSNIIMALSLSIKAGNTNPPTAVIERTHYADLAADLAGKRYVKVEAGTIPATAIVKTTYVDEKGESHDVDAIEITNVSTTLSLSSGWYVVNGTDVQTSSLVCKGEVRLILADDAKLTATGAFEKAGIQVSGEGNTLAIYAQTAQSGQLIATGGDYAAGIGGGAGGNGSNITINGGIVTATGGARGGAGIGGGTMSYGSNITILAGTVVANGGEGYTTTKRSISAGDAIGNGGDEGEQSVTPSNIFIATSLLVEADGNNPPATTITNDGSDLASSLAGKRYAAIREKTLSEIKTDAVAEIDAAIEGVTDEAILTIATTAKTNIGTATTKEGVETVKTQALADIAAAIFAKYKVAAVAEIDAAIEGVTDEAILAIATTAKTNIGTATTEEGVDAIKTQALADIALAKAKADAIATIQAAANSAKAEIDAASSYEAAKATQAEYKEKIDNAVSAAKDAINNATTEATVDEKRAATASDIESKKAEALSKIAAINDLAKAKADAIAEIQEKGEGIQNTELNQWIDGAISDIEKSNDKGEIDRIKGEILPMIQLFQDGKAEGLAEAQAALPTDGTSGPAVVITQGDKSITLINPDEVKYTIITEE